jgi:hypothetical protein
MVHVGPQYYRDGSICVFAVIGYVLVFVLDYMFHRVSLHLCAFMLLLLAFSCGCLVVSLFVSYLLCAHIKVFLVCLPVLLQQSAFVKGF